MVTEKRIVAFVDILGFTNLIKEYQNGQKDVLPKLVAAMKSSTSLLKDKQPVEDNDTSTWKDCLEVRLFSDCLCASIPLHHPNFDFEYHFSMFYRYLIGYQQILMLDGFFTRGGVDIGDYYSDENIIFSEALVHAYELESKNAKMPRIIISDRVLDTIQKNITKEVSEKMIQKDNDSLFFLHPFNNQILDEAQINPNLFDNSELKNMLLTINDTRNQRRKRDIKIISEIAHKKVDKYLTQKKEHIAEKYQWMIDLCKKELKNE